MRVTETAVSFGADSCTYRATVRSDARGEPLVLWYQFPVELRSCVDINSGNALAAALLLPAMRHGEHLELPVPISPKLARALNRIQIIYHAWDPTLSIIDVIAPLRANTSPGGAEVGLFFSCGVDSFYSLVRNTMDHPLNEDVITSLIVVRGLDTEINRDRNVIYEAMLTNACRIAQHLGKKVFGVSTNVKKVMAALGYPTGLFGHGASLASVGLILAPMFTKLYIAASDSYAYLPPESSHPVLDPLWSTEYTSFIHDGCEATRLEKIKIISGSSYAMEALRVCSRVGFTPEAESDTGPELNCGRCSKCMRTMVELYAAGALGRCRTLPNDIDTAALERIHLHSGEFEFHYMQEVVDALKDSETDARIRAGLEKCLATQKAYFARQERFRKAINRLIPPRAKFILVEQDGIWKTLGGGRNIVRFLERDGEYYGNPPGDEVAVRELERLRCDGVEFMVFWWPEFWWFDYYSGLNRHLRSHYRPVVEDDTVVVFDLSGAPEADGRG